MPRTAALGLPRMGPDRELKFALEAFWSGDASVEELSATAKRLRAANWELVRDAGVDVVPSGEFSLYDHVLDTAWALGAIPERFGTADREDLTAYFRLARGDDAAHPLEMTKWFDTNYHYLVPELTPGMALSPDAGHWTRALAESDALGIATRPVVLGPFSFLLLAKGLERPLDELPAYTAAYVELLQSIAGAGATEIQLDEPVLALDRTPEELDAFAGAWTALRDAVPDVELSLATYFAGLDTSGALETIAALAPAELHLDLVRAPGQLDPALDALAGTATRLSLGVLDGRNVWAADPDVALGHVDRAIGALGAERVTIAPSCPMLHLPYGAAREEGIDAEVRPWLAFMTERLSELDLLARVLAAPDERDTLLASARAVQSARRRSAHTNDPAVRARVGALSPADYARADPAPERLSAQQERLGLPELPTTTIGSFPQTAEIRTARRERKAGTLGEEAYTQAMRDQVQHVVAVQEELDLDVFVHGEPERNDMVEYFGEQLSGFTFSGWGWVQSYGSRCVKPPILFGDVSRPEPMTVGWWRYAQGLTERPMKGMLTGPVTILQWSFVRDDQPREETCTQIALAIADEVADLEAAGAAVIQVDEAALREGLPLQRADQEAYNRWAVDCFRLSVAPAAAQTQVHTHMCYSEFNEIMDHIVRLDADVISIEASRSGMEVLDVFTGEASYPNDIGPGVYDIHSPRVPSQAEMESLLALAEERVGRERLWVNPDCGLKTRRWEDVMPALEHLVAAAHARRAAVGAGR